METRKPHKGIDLYLGVRYNFLWVCKGDLLPRKIRGEGKDEFSIV